MCLMGEPGEQQIVLGLLSMASKCTHLHHHKNISIVQGQCVRRIVRAVR